MFFWIKKLHKHKVPEKIKSRIMDNMIAVPTGSFLMGSSQGEDDERPIHNVLINSFLFSKFPVSQAEWFAVMRTTPWEDNEHIRPGDNCPVVNVDWYECREFIKRLSHETALPFRLPTEAEWEFCCRAGTTSRFYHGNFRLGLPSNAWYYENAFKKGEMYPHESGLKKPNQWGFHDMMGNIYEWCSDWYGRNYYNKSPVNNPQGPRYGKYRIVRGGDWARTDYFLRVASRRYYSPHYKDCNVGFRLALTTLGE